MAKVLETIFRIMGQVDGSVMSAIRTATGALRGLSLAAGRMNGLSGRQGLLQSRLDEMRKLEQMIQRYRQLSDGLGRGKIGRNQFAELTRIAGELQRAGLSTERLGQAMMMLQRGISQTTSELNRMQGALSRLSNARTNADVAGTKFSTEWWR